MDFLYPLTSAVILLFLLSFISNRLNFISIPLFIIGGIILRPFIKDNIDIIRLPSELGLLFLLFFIGFEISPLKYLKNIKKILFDGSIDLIISFLLPLIILLVFLKDIRVALFISSMIYISSSAIDLKIIVDYRLAIYSFAEKAINILLFQDLFISLLLIMLPLLFVEFESKVLFVASSRVIIFAAYLTIVYAILKISKDIINRCAEETIILLSFAILVMSSFISQRLINSEVMGAFMAGSIIKAIGYRIDLKKSFAPVKDLFSPFFFLYFGTGIEISSVYMGSLMAILILLLSVITKYTISYIIYPHKQFKTFRNILFGLLTIRGEFSIVIAAISSQYLNNHYSSFVSMVSTLIIFINLFLGLIAIRIFEKGLHTTNK